jgi:hypothetical protein
MIILPKLKIDSNYFSLIKEPLVNVDLSTNHITFIQLSDPKSLFMKDYESAFTSRTVLWSQARLYVFDCLKNQQHVVRLILYEVDQSG